jgi:hypothetical protein
LDTALMEPMYLLPLTVLHALWHNPKMI